MAESGMSTFPDPVNPNDPGRGPTVMGLAWKWSALALIVVGLRFWVRIAVTKLLVVEDWLMLAAVVLNTLCLSCITVSFSHGLGKHDTDLTFDQLVNVGKWTWMSFTPGIVCSMLARVSIAILLVRIFGTKPWLKWFLVIITILQVVGGVVLAIASWAQTRPVEALWNPSIPAKRLDPMLVPRMGNVVGALFALGDLLYVVLLMRVVWTLHMPLSRKAGLCVLLALSLFTMGASIAKAVTSAGGADDALYNTSMSLMWSVTEQTFVIMMECAPPLSSVTKLNLKLPSVLGISASFMRLMRSRGSTGYPMKDSSEPGRSCERIRTAEMRVKEAGSSRGSGGERGVYWI